MLPVPDFDPQTACDPINCSWDVIAVLDHGERARASELLTSVYSWFREGFAAVDMETATTYAVAESFGMSRLSILYGFDNPRRRDNYLQVSRHTRAGAGLRRAAIRWPTAFRLVVVPGGPARADENGR